MIFALPKVDKDGVYAIHDTPQNRLGEYFCDNRDNRLWVYVCANEALKQGTAIQSEYPTNANSPSGLVAATAGTTRLTFTRNINIQSEVPTHPKFSDTAIIQVRPATAANQYGTVRSHGKRNCEVEWLTGKDGTLPINVEANASYAFIVPWLVEKADATRHVLGFAQRNIPAGKYFWALVEGVGLGLNDATALSDAQDSPLWVTGTTGVLDDAISGDETPPVAYSLADAAKANEPVLIIATASARISLTPLQQMGTYRAAYQPPT